jgi:glycosyltransferase involved in cell wall biosynthesis
MVRQRRKTSSIDRTPTRKRQRANGNAPPRAAAEESNAIHGLWIGRHLSRLEKLTLLSFVRHGHAFNLWAYDELDEPLPPGVILRDAAQILPRERIFLKVETDPSAGVGCKSYGPFSDLFRYKLLYEHGGIWVDMDITCLRPFDFTEPYVFRAHRIGLMGNLMKVPPRSELMRQTFEMADKVADENVSWLTLNKILRNNVRYLQLDKYIRKNLINDGSLADTILEYAGSPFRTPPPYWYGIHWGNEFWGKQTCEHSESNGTFATKNDPVVGSFLHELYRTHGLINPREMSAPPMATQKPAVTRAVLNGRLAEVVNGAPAPNTRRSINMLIPTLVRGGAERIVVEIGAALVDDPEVDVYVYVRSRTATTHEVSVRKNLFIVYLDDPGPQGLVELASELVKHGNPLLFTHLIKRHDLEVLWQAGVLTVPVVHNSKQGWGEPPNSYNHANVPFVVACADSVKLEVEKAGCTRPVVTIRHEIGITPGRGDLLEGRNRIRSAWGIGDDTLLIGMVGQFKTQKAYTRAVRVLSRVQKFVTAKLMIVGGWNHKYGAGRIAFEATMRLAVELGVVADMILIGETTDPIPYLAAFDVFLNTSIFEGLSVSLMEAIACGCPLVVSDVGGTAEICPGDAVLVKDSADIDGYVVGIMHVMTRDVRSVPAPRHEPDLIPRIWLGLSRVAIELCKPRYPEPNGTLFVIDGLHLGGPAISLARVLAATRRRCRVGVATLFGASVPELEEDIRRAGAAVFHLPTAVFVSRTAENLLEVLSRNNYRSVCFWNAPPELKLLVAKLLEPSRISLIDVSPGPMWFDEINAAAGFQQRIAFTSRQYLRRLERFVALHRSGVPAFGKKAVTRHSVIPLGVPPRPRYVPLPPAHLLLPENIDMNLAVGTVTRLVPYKRIETLLEAMSILTRHIPGASLTIVGGPDASSTDYASGLLRKARELGLDKIFFVGPYLEVDRFLAQWQVFVLAGERQGCPNASLEAMAMELPVIAFASGGLDEQIVEGRTGYLVKTPEQMAVRLKLLLEDATLRRRMGKQARARIHDGFSLNRSAQAFAEVIDI